MTRFSDTVYRGLLLSAVLLLSACGGGDDDEASRAITPGNAATVTELTFNNAADLIDVAEVAGFAIEWLIEEQYVPAGNVMAAKGVAEKSTLTFSNKCPLGGSATATINDTNGNFIFDPGESASFQFSSCRIPGVNLNVSGGLTVTFTAYTETSNGTDSSGSFVFTNLVVKSPSASVPEKTVSGDMSLVYNWIASTIPRQRKFTATGTSLKLSVVGAAWTLTSYRATNTQEITTTDTDNTNVASYSYTIAGNLSGTNIPGTVALTTPVAIAGLTDQYPTAGELLVTAQNGSTLRIVATPPTGVTVTADSNADGQVDFTETLPWTSLGPI